MLTAINNKNNNNKNNNNTAILGTAHILREVLTYRYNGVNAGPSIYTHHE
jgi:hypothetical protein